MERLRWTPKNHALEPGQHGPKFRIRQLWVLENLNNLTSKEREQVIDIAMGFYFGFPICCIKFYVYKWVPRYDNGIEPTWVDTHREAMHQADPGNTTQRILCPKCISLMVKQAQQRAKVGRMGGPISGLGVGGGVHTRRKPRSSNLGRSKRAE